MSCHGCKFLDLHLRNAFTTCRIRFRAPIQAREVTQLRFCYRLEPLHKSIPFTFPDLFDAGLSLRECFDGVYSDVGNKA